MIPQIIILILASVGLGISISRHGKVREEKENFWATLIARFIVLALLYWGGFFNVFFK